ncbi:MAG TPA: glycosyltransferase [Anaerolineales bacterium]
MKILFLSRWFPYPLDNGSKIRIYHLLRALNTRHEVTLLSFIDQPGRDMDVPEIRAICSEVHGVVWKEFNPESREARLGFLSLKPRSIIDTFSEEMAQKITGLLRSQKFDLVVASQLPMAAYYPNFLHMPALFEELELGLSYEDSHQATDWKKGLRRSLTWFKLRHYLDRLISAFQGVTVVSEAERALVLRLFPGLKNVTVVPNCVNFEDYQTVPVEPKPNQIIFTGSFRYHANYEAMRWFVGEVFPLVLQKIPDAELVITGDHAGLTLPSVTNIDLAGYVEDIHSMIASAAVSIAPLWSGGGTRLKILEAMAIGTPVVATSKGAEGLEVVNGDHLSISDDPEGFSECIIQLMKNSDLRRRIADCAKRLVKDKYSWERTGPEYVKLVENLADSMTATERIAR